MNKIKQALIWVVLLTHSCTPEPAYSDDSPSGDAGSFLATPGPADIDDGVDTSSGGDDGD